MNIARTCYIVVRRQDGAILCRGADGNIFLRQDEIVNERIHTYRTEAVALAAVYVSHGYLSGHVFVEQVLETIVSFDGGTT